MITRENYEAYFLLYTDNELSAAERTAVEAFVAGHPDLREEWEAFLQCKVHPDAQLVFPGQASLLRPETGESVYTADLILYLDGELDPPNAARIEATIRREPRVANELAALRQTVARPDMTIGYPDKPGLFKPTGSRRIIVLPWVRVGVAAAIAGAIVLGLLLPARRQNPVEPPQVVKVTREGTKPEPAHKDDRYLPAAVTFVTVSPLHDSGKQPIRVAARKEPAAHAPERMSPDDIGTLTAADPGKSQLQPDAAAAIDMSKVSRMTAIQPAGPHPEAGAGRNDVAVNQYPAVRQGTPGAESSFATQALQEEANDERAGNLVGDEQAAPAKAGLRGLFRKVTRALGKTADRDDDGNRQVLVGAFQVPIN